MPRVRFVLVTCPQCGVDYRVRLERLESGGPAECLGCGAAILVAQYTPLLKALHRLGDALEEAERLVRIEGETAVPHSGMQSTPSPF